MSWKYDDLLELPHHVSATRPRMSAADRAAQFSAFAALTGFGAVISETGRLTDARVELDEYEQAALNARLVALRARLAEQPVVTATYFRPDARKAGGTYVTVTGAVRHIDAQSGALLLADGTRVPFDSLLELTDAREAGKGK